LDWVTEPDPDRGNVDGALIRLLAFVVAGGDGAVDLKLVDAALDDVAVLVLVAVEGQ
jgi:hypothetical protein